MSKPKAKTTVTKETIIDQITGEILSSKETVNIENQSFSEPEPEFIKLYIKHLGKIQGLNNSQSSVLFEIASRMPYANNSDQNIILNSFVKRQIAGKLGVTEQYISDTISCLVKEKMLFKVTDRPKARTGAYQINPLYIARGQWVDIKKLQLKVGFDSKNGQTIDGVDIIKNDGSVETITNKAIMEAASSILPEDEQINILDYLKRAEKEQAAMLCAVK